MASLRELLPAATDGHAPPQSPQSQTTSRAVVQPATSSPKAGVSKLLVLSTDTANGDPDYAAIVRQGENATRTVHASHDALVEKPLSEVAGDAPSSTEKTATAEHTRAVLERRIVATTGALRRPSITKPASSAAATGNTNSQATYLRYTPANHTRKSAGDSNGDDAAAVAVAPRNQQRIIKMVTRQVDPMEPPRHRHVKAPANPPSPPVPLLHSPERRATKEEQREWNIPPVVSDWKNNRGYTISLDKRLAADARGALDHSVNDRFASMADALFNAERDARRDVELRARLQRQVSIRAKTARERELRDLADRARRERQGFAPVPERDDSQPAEVDDAPPPSPPPPSVAPQPVPDDQPPSFEAATQNITRQPTEHSPPQPSNSTLETQAPKQPQASRPISARPRTRRSRFSSAPEEGSGTKVENSQPRLHENKHTGGHAIAKEDDEDEAGLRQRDAIRRERREERERELRLLEGAARGGKRGRVSRDADRDFTERAALGQLQPQQHRSAELLFDERLFSRGGPAAGSRGGRSLAGGFGADDAHSLYEAPLFKGADERARARWRGSAPSGATQASRSGAAQATNNGTAKEQDVRRREGPVQFERDTQLKSSVDDQDSYGLNKLFNDARKNRSDESSR